MFSFYIAMTISRAMIVLLGILGNIISFIVFSRKTFRNNSISTYCRALAVLDCLTIIELIENVYRIVNFRSYIFFSNESDIWCKLFYYLSAQYSAIPAWILVAFSVDKMLNMRISPPQMLKSKLFQWMIVTGIVLLHFILYIELLTSLKLEISPFNKTYYNSSYVCNYTFLSYFYPLLYAQLSETCIIPFAIMIVTSCITISLLIRSRSHLERTGNADKRRRMRDIKFAISSLAFNVVFIAFKMPFFISYFLFKNFDFNQIAFLFFLVNCSSNFFIHFATNSIFRRELFAIFGRKRSPQGIMHQCRQFEVFLLPVIVQ
jgi:hypothetical protein